MRLSAVSFEELAEVQWVSCMHHLETCKLIALVSQGAWGRWRDNGKPHCIWISQTCSAGGYLLVSSHIFGYRKSMDSFSALLWNRYSGAFCKPCISSWTFNKVHAGPSRQVQVFWSGRGFPVDKSSCQRTAIRRGRRLCKRARQGACVVGQVGRRSRRYKEEAQKGGWSTDRGNSKIPS